MLVIVSLVCINFCQGFQCCWELYGVMFLLLLCLILNALFTINCLHHTVGGEYRLGANISNVQLKVRVLVTPWDISNILRVLVNSNTLEVPGYKKYLLLALLG